MSNSNHAATVPSFAATKKLVFSAMGIALAFITSYLKLWNMPMGGSVTLLSMLFISLIGYWFGTRYGIATGAAFGLLQFLINPYILSIPQVILDYPLAFGALGLSGLFRNHKFGLRLGYIAGVLGRFVFSTLSGVVFFASYAPEGMNPWVYSIAYQGSYLGTEAVLTLIIISLPPVTKALKTVKMQAER